MFSLKKDYFKYNTVNKNDTIIERKIKERYLLSLNYKIEEKKKELVEKERLVEEKREELKKSQIERKTVELLKEKKIEEYKKEEQLIEQKANDEFALFGYIRKNSERR